MQLLCRWQLVVSLAFYALVHFWILPSSPWALFLHSIALLVGVGGKRLFNNSIQTSVDPMRFSNSNIHFLRLLPCFADCVDGGIF